MAALSAGRAHEVIRLEQIAEQAVTDAGDYADAFDDHLQRRRPPRWRPSRSWPYRGGFDGDLSEPTRSEVADAAARWRDAAAGG